MLFPAKIQIRIRMNVQVSPKRRRGSTSFVQKPFWPTDILSTQHKTQLIIFLTIGIVVSFKHCAAPKSIDWPNNRVIDMSAKCLLDKCLLVKCLLAKCLLAKYLLAKYFLPDVFWSNVCWPNVFCQISVGQMSLIQMSVRQTLVWQISVSKMSWPNYCQPNACWRNAC